VALAKVEARRYAIFKAYGARIIRITEDTGVTAGAVEATALRVPLAVLAVALTAATVGCSLTEAYY